MKFVKMVVMIAGLLGFGQVALGEGAVSQSKRSEASTKGTVTGTVKKKVVRKKQAGKKSSKKKGKQNEVLFTEFHFNKVNLGGRLKEPMVEFIEQGKDSFEPDFIQIRTRWTEEMVASATNLDNDGDDTVWELFYTIE